MKSLVNPSSLEELKKFIPVAGPHRLINNGYILEYMENADAELRRYENSEEVKEEYIYVGYMMYDDFNSFMKELKSYVGRKKVYLSIEYATVLLAYLNGGKPEDYICK